MRRPRMTIQWFMVAVVFLAIFLWAGPVLVSEAVRRWRVCSVRAARYQAQARAGSLRATRLAARSMHRAAAFERSTAEEDARKAREYRRALLIPWEFWALGDP